VRRMEYVLHCVEEEALEVALAISKAQRFGMHDHHPNDPPGITNAVKILGEFNDLICMLRMAGFDTTPDEELISNHREQVLHYMEYSVRAGIIE
jgi:hypothetical protein